MRALTAALWLWGLALFAAAASLDPTSCPAGVDVSPIRKELRYSGPHQRVFRDYKMNLRCFNGQHFEDLFMFQHYLGRTAGGFFVELGALDGLSYSVSYFFEQFMGWRGLLIEASPKNFHEYYRKMKKLSRAHRRKSDFLLAAVCGEPGAVTYVSKEGTGAGILEFMPPDQQQRNREKCREATVEEAAADHRSACSLVKINCVHLGDLLRQRNVSKVDLFVLDVEGAELEVLRTLRLHEIPIHFFLIELDGKSPAKDAAVRCLLREHAYEPVGRLDLNEVWRKSDFDVSAYTYDAVPRVESWSQCFRSKLAPDGFFKATTITPPRVRDKGREGALLDGTTGDAQKEKEGLDADMEEFEPITKRPHPAAVAHDDVDAGNDLLNGVTLMLIVGFPLCLMGCIAVRRKRLK